MLKITQNTVKAYATSTKATYKSQLRTYLTFCVLLWVPATSSFCITLSSYAAFLARSLSASSIPAYLNIIRILHLEHGLEDPTKNNFHLATTLRGIRRCSAFGYQVTFELGRPSSCHLLGCLLNRLLWSSSQS